MKKWITENFIIKAFITIALILVFLIIRKKAKANPMNEATFIKKLPTQMSVSNIEHFKRWEGYRTEAYKDSGGLWTTGIGHLIKASESYLKTKKLTESEVLSMFRKDVLTAENVVKSKIKIPISQGLFDALVSLAFNTGTIYNYIITLVNAGDYSALAKRWLTTAITVNKGKTIVQGLKNRRLAETKLFI